MMGDRSATINGLHMEVGTPYVLESVDLPSSDFRTQDTDNPVGDGTIMGRDRLTPGTMTLNVHLLGDDSADVNARLRDFTRAWNTAVDRTQPGATTSLRWQDGGVPRLVYGRPRTLAVNNEESRHGLIRVTAAFKLSDAATYDVGEAQREVRIDSIPPPAGGLIDPLVAPLTATGYATRQGLIEDTGGEAPTPFRVVFHGPVSNPFLTGPGWRIKLNTSLAWDEVVTVDTRTGTVVSNLGRNMKPFLDAKSRLRDVRLAPGRTEIEFGGNDPTRTAYVLVQWQPAFYI